MLTKIVDFIADFGCVLILPTFAVIGVVGWAWGFR